MGDGSLAAAVWEGAIPLSLSLDEHEVATPQTPPSLFALVPRHAYLPMLSNAAFAHFGDVLPPGDNQLWFDAGGVPLKWQLPLGVLHDLLGSGELPWRLRVHFRAFPEGLLTHCSGPDAVRGHLFNSLKVRLLQHVQHSVAALTQPPPAPGGLLSRQRQRFRGADTALDGADGRVAGTGPALWRRQESTDVVSHGAPQGFLDRDFARYKRGAAALSASSRSGRCDARASRKVAAHYLASHVLQESERTTARAWCALGWHARLARRRVIFACIARGRYEHAARAVGRAAA